MTVKELINELLDCEMDYDVCLGTNKINGFVKLDEVEETRGNRTVHLNFPFEASDLDLDELGLKEKGDDDE